MAHPLGELRRLLGTVTGIAVCIGMAVGAGILRAPGEIAAVLPDPVWILGVWCLGALIATLDALILAEMSSSVPRVGGLVAYVHLSFGALPAFLVGWSMLLVTWPASLASVGVAIGELLAGGGLDWDGAAGPTPLGRGIAVLVIAAVGGLNLLGLRIGARFEVLLLVLKVTLLGGICMAAALAAPAPAPMAPVAMPSGGALLAALGTAMAQVIFSFDGYADAVYLAGETRDPGRALPRALFTALGTITGLYLLANLTFLQVLGTAGLAHSRFPALDVAQTAFGPAGAHLLTASALVIMLGAVNAYFLTGPRIARVLAEEGLALPAFGRMPASGAAATPILWIVGVAVVFALTNSFGSLIEVTVPIISATTAMVAIGLLVQRRRAPTRERPFRVPAAPWVVGLQVAIGLLLLASFLRARPTAILIDAGALAVGTLLFFARRR